MAHKTASDLLSLREAGARLGVGPDRAKQLATKNVIPYVWIGHRRKVPRLALDEWMREQADRALAITRKAV